MRTQTGVGLSFPRSIAPGETVTCVERVTRSFRPGFAAQPSSLLSLRPWPATDYSAFRCEAALVGMERILCLEGRTLADVVSAEDRRALDPRPPAMLAGLDVSVQITNVSDKEQPFSVGFFGEALS